MKKIGLILAVVALALTMAGPGLAQGKAQTACPVLQGNVDKNVYVDYKGHRIYFCCKGCDAEFKKDPEKYLKKLESQGVTLEKSPAAAPKGGK
jgi:YHS domain-containing protein